MQILMGTEGCGFGPASKLVAIARHLPSATRRFVGDGVAVDFALRNQGAFSSVQTLRPECPQEIKPLIEACDCAIVVMHDGLAFDVVEAGRPLYFFDSLFSFWQLDHDIKDLVGLAREVRRRGMSPMRGQLNVLTRHERMMMSHLIATRSFVQNFVGVEARVGELRQLGVDHVEITGPMVSSEGFVSSENLHVVEQNDSSDWEMLVNLGGFKNFLLDFEHNNAFLLLLERWVLDFIKDDPTCRKIMVCCGAYSSPREVHIGERSVEFTLLSHEVFLRTLARTPVYLCTPGLTALNEAAKMGRFPLLLPEEHFNHICNARALKGTLIGELAVRFEDVLSPYIVPKDAIPAATAILEYTRALLASESDYQRFRTLLNARVTQLRTLPGTSREQGVRELREVFSGPSLQSAINTVLRDLEG